MIFRSKSPTVKVLKEDVEAESVSSALEELLDKLDISPSGNISEDGAYVIDIINSNEYGKINSKLDKSGILEFIDDTSFVTVENASLNYMYEDQFQLTLIADFDEDAYRLVITEI